RGRLHPRTWPGARRARARALPAHVMGQIPPEERSDMSRFAGRWPRPRASGRAPDSESALAVRGSGPPTASRMHHVIVSFCMAMVVLLLLVDGLTTKTLGAAGTDGPSVDAPLASSGPILVANGHGGLISRAAAPGRRIALTFDDGPNPRWTPKILSIL